MSLKDWSVTAASNTSAPPNGAPEGMAMANVNNTMRQIMADVRTLAAEDNIASATTCDLGTKDATFLTITGTTTITGFGTVSAGIYKFVKFSGALTLTHNATSLILLTGANRTTVAGDCALYKSEGSGNWREYFYSNQNDYQPLDDQLTTLSGITAQQATDLASLSTFVGTLLNDADASTALGTLGFSAFAKTIIDDASGDAVFTTLGAAKSLATSGYQKLPSGLIIQWGRAVKTATGTLAITLPLTFPNAAFIGVPVPSYTSTVNYPEVAYSLTTTTLTVNSSNFGVDYYVNWIAIGN